MDPQVRYLAADFAWLSVPPQDLIRAGYNGGSLRYISHDGSKDATRIEIDNMHEAGLPVALMYESTAERSREGKQAGRDDANFFNDRLAWLGAPLSVMRRTTSDFDSGDESLPYYEGWAEVNDGLTRGTYGSGYLVRRLKQLGLIDPGGGWQTLSKGFRESTPTNFRYVDMVQDFPSRGMNGWSASQWMWDENRIYVADWGAWYPPGWKKNSKNDEEEPMIALAGGRAVPFTVRPHDGKVYLRASVDSVGNMRLAYGPNSKPYLKDNEKLAHFTRADYDITGASTGSVKAYALMPDGVTSASDISFVIDYV